MIQSKLINGGRHQDNRGKLIYNNDFDASDVKRIYCIENLSTEKARAWQGHQIESRWFAVAHGNFSIKLIQVDDWQNPNPNLPQETYHLNENQLDVLYVPPGYISSIQSLSNGSKIIIMADYKLGEVEDNHKFPADHFNEN